MPESLEPLGDRVLVRRHEEKTPNKNGLLMPDGAKEKPAKGTILAVGNGRKLDNGTILRVDLEAGQVVTFGKFAGSEFTLNGETLLIMREDEVIGRVSGEADHEPELPSGVAPLARNVTFSKRGPNVARPDKKRKRK